MGWWSSAPGRDAPRERGPQRAGRFCALYALRWTESSPRRASQRSPRLCPASTPQSNAGERGSALGSQAHASSRPVSTGLRPMWWRQDLAPEARRWGGSLLPARLDTAVVSRPRLWNCERRCPRSALAAAGPADRGPRAAGPIYGWSTEGFDTALRRLRLSRDCPGSATRAPEPPRSLQGAWPVCSHRPPMLPGRKGKRQG